MLNFHKAELSDAQEIAALINSAYRGESSRAGWTTEADILDGLRTTTQEIASIIQREDAFILVGVLRDQIVATVCCERQDAYGRNIAHFGMIAVKPTMQNKGHGSTMLQAAEAMTSREWRVVGFHMAVINRYSFSLTFVPRPAGAGAGGAEALTLPPGRTFCRPSATTRSPAFKPSTIST